MTQDDVPRQFADEGKFQIEDEDEEDDDMELVDVLEGEFVDETDESDGEVIVEETDDIAIFNISSVPSPQRSDARRSFDHHSASVFSCAFHPNGKIAASGGEDDRAYIFDVETGTVLLTAIGFSDSVTHVEFSYDGKYLAAGDMAGRIVVWKIIESVLTEVWSDTVPDCTWLSWHPQANVLLVSGNGIWMFKIPSGQCKVYPGSGYSTEVGSFMPDGKRAIFGFEDGSVRVFELTRGAVPCKFNAGWNGSEGIISLAVHPDNSLAAVGSASGDLSLINTQNQKIVSKLNCSEDDSESPCVEAIEFGGESGLNILVAGTDFCLHIWDYGRLSLRHKIKIEEGVTRMVWPTGSQFIYVGTNTGLIRIFNVYSGLEMCPLYGNQNSVLDIRASRDGKLLMTCGDDKHVRIFNLGEEKLL